MSLQRSWHLRQVEAGPVDHDLSELATLLDRGPSAGTEAVGAWRSMAHGGDLSLAEEHVRYRPQPLKHPDPAAMPCDEACGGERVSFVGVLLSRHTRDLRARGPHASPDCHRYWSTLLGTHAMLAEEQILHSCLHEERLEQDDLGPLQAIVLPDAACLSDAACERLREFVAAGGLLVASFESTLFEPHGRQRADFALADLFGASWRGTIGRDGSEARRGLFVEDAELTGGIQHICIGAAYCLVEAHEDAQVLATSAAYGGNSGGVPAIVLNRFGAGETAYFAEDIGAGYCSQPHLWTREAFTRMVLRRPHPVEIDGPSVLYAKVFRADGELRVHLLNLPFATNPMVGRNATTTVGEVLPIYGVEITVRPQAITHGGPPSRAHSVVRGGELPTRRNAAGELVITLPRLDSHEIILIS